jgi:transposase
MMGRKALGGKLFYQVSLEELVPAGHLLRRVAEAVDFGVARRLTARFYSHTGQPSVDPVVLFKMALLGYLYGLPSERRLVDEIRVNLAYRWVIGYDLDEAVPDHSVLSKARRGGGEAGAAGISAGGDGPVRGVRLALAVRGRVLHAGCWA